MGESKIFCVCLVERAEVEISSRLIVSEATSVEIGGVWVSDSELSLCDRLGHRESNTGTECRTPASRVSVFSVVRTDDVTAHDEVNEEEDTG